MVSNTDINKNRLNILLNYDEIKDILELTEIVWTYVA